MNTYKLNVSVNEIEKGEKLQQYLYNKVDKLTIGLSYFYYEFVFSCDFNTYNVIEKYYKKLFKN